MCLYPLDIFPVVDRTLYPKQHWRTYLKNYRAKFGHLHSDHAVTGVTTINRARGCSRAKEPHTCKHCDMLLDTSMSSAHVFWKEVQVANRQVRADIFTKFAIA